MWPMCHFSLVDIVACAGVHPRLNAPKPAHPIASIKGLPELCRLASDSDFLISACSGSEAAQSFMIAEGGQGGGGRWGSVFRIFSHAYQAPSSNFGVFGQDGFLLASLHVDGILLQLGNVRTDYCMNTLSRRILRLCANTCPKT